VTITCGVTPAVAGALVNVPPVAVRLAPDSRRPDTPEIRGGRGLMIPPVRQITR
jgi:hypothetical protein